MGPKKPTCRPAGTWRLGSFTPADVEAGLGAQRAGCLVVAGRRGEGGTIAGVGVVVAEGTLRC